MLTADNITTLQDKHYKAYITFCTSYITTLQELRLNVGLLWVRSPWPLYPSGPRSQAQYWCGHHLTIVVHIVPWTCNGIVSRYPLVIQVNTDIVRWPFCCFQEFLFKNKCLNPQKSINTRLHWLCVQTVKIFVKKCSAALMFPPPPLWPIPEVTNFPNGAPQLELETNLREVWITEKAMWDTGGLFSNVIVPYDLHFYTYHNCKTSNFAKVRFQL